VIPIPNKLEISVELKDSCNNCRCCFGCKFFRNIQPKPIKTDEKVIIDTELKVDRTFINVMSKSGESFSDNE
jgi:hypothetical protein